MLRDDMHEIGDDPNNPTIGVQLVGVDVDAIIEQARAVDNVGNRQQKVREILFEEIAVTEQQELFYKRDVDWRGTRRSTLGVTRP